MTSIGVVSVSLLAVFSSVSPAPAGGDCAWRDAFRQIAAALTVTACHFLALHLDDSYCLARTF